MSKFRDLNVCLDPDASAKPLVDIQVKLIGTDGNAFAILGNVRRAIAKSDKPELADKFMNEAMQGDYDHVLRTCMKYVEVV